MSTRRIRETVQELYGIDVSADLIARVTDAVLDEFSEWQNRQLADTYAIVHLIRHSLSSSSYRERRQLAAALNRFIKQKVRIESNRC